MRKHSYSIVTPARWETDSIVEWVAYHRSIGFNHIYIYCNDDDPAELFDRLLPFLAAPRPFVSFVHYPFQGLQWNIYMHWFERHADETEWCAFLDADEFLCIPGLDSIADFQSGFPPECDVIHFHWIYYGNSGFRTRPPGSVLRQYNRRAADVSFETKTMMRASKVRIADLRPEQPGFWHLWDDGRDGMKAFTSLGTRLGGHFDRTQFASDHADDIRRTAYVAHFAMKSEEDFLRRRDRGLGGQYQGQQIWADMRNAGRDAAFLANINAEEDDYLQRYWTRLVGSAADTRLIAPPPGINIARGRPATQSSVSDWSKHPDREQDAAGAVSGIITGKPSFHTGKELHPWWQVDLGSIFKLSEIRIFNRVDDPGVAARANRLSLNGSNDGTEFNELFRRDEDAAFGGADGRPLIWRPEGTVLVRILRIILRDTTWLALDEVEIYGAAWDGAGST